MEPIVFLQDLAIVIIGAAVAAVLFARLRQPVVLGYILAGLAIGPHTPPFQLVNNEATIHALSELGVIFLMFILGLEFSLRKLRAVGGSAVIGATLEVMFMGCVGYMAGRLMGWLPMDSVYLGAILAVSSTMIITKALNELGKGKEPFAQLIFGILIVEDILSIVMIALLSGFTTTGTLSGESVGLTLVQLGSFLGVLLVFGLILVPRMLAYIARFKSAEVLLLTVVGLCVGVALLTEALGYSVALGAFLIGAIIAEARQIEWIEMLMKPLRDLFSAVFFVSIGLLIDPVLIVQYWQPILMLSAVVVVGKVLVCSFGTFTAGNDLRTSLHVGMGMAQIGEFSFIIAALGVTLRATSDFLYPTVVAVSVVTTLLTPYLIRNTDGLVGWFDRVAPASVVDFLEGYTCWVSRMGSRKGHPGWTFLVRWGWQIGINLLLVTGVFIGAAFFQGRLAEWLPQQAWFARFIRWTDGLHWGASFWQEHGIRPLIWLGAMAVCLPMLVAVFRKLQAAAMLVAEMCVPRTEGGKSTEALRRVVGNTVLVTALLGLSLFLLLLSSAILSSWGVLLGLLLVPLGAAGLFWRFCVQIYSRAQIALLETFADSDPKAHAAGAHPTAHSATHLTEGAPPPVTLLLDTQLMRIQLDAAAAAVGKLIAELQLRTLSGASIVGIERAGKTVVNPGPQEELQPGDQLLLLGSAEQVEAARAVLK